MAEVWHVPPWSLEEDGPPSWATKETWKTRYREVRRIKSDIETFQSSGKMSLAMQEAFAPANVTFVER